MQKNESIAADNIDIDMLVREVHDGLGILQQLHTFTTTDALELQQ